MMPSNVLHHAEQSPIIYDATTLPVATVPFRNQDWVQSKFVKMQQKLLRM